MRMPVYDVQIVGYPQRMRDHDARQRILRAASAAATWAPDRIGTCAWPERTWFPSPAPRARRRQPFSAMSGSTATRVRTGTPVPPFVV